jgi:DnaJ-domain-containing protein 1
VLAFALAAAKDETAKAVRRAAAAEAAAAAAEAGRCAASESLSVMASHHGRLVAALEAERAERRRAETAHEAAYAALLARAHSAEGELERLQALLAARGPSPATAARTAPQAPPPPLHASPPARPREASPPAAPPPPATPWAVRRLREADARKAKGNALFREGLFEAAAAEYSAGLAAAPGASAAAGGGGERANALRAVLHSNRAAAQQAQGRLLDAALDCSVALSLDPSYRRARERRADVLTQMGDAAGASADLRALCAAADGASPADADAAAARAKLAELEARAPRRSGEDAGGGGGGGGVILADHYAVLGLPPGASAAEAKAAFRALALRHHPDKAAAEGGAPLRAAAQALFVLLNAAHTCLTDPAERRRYDAQRAAGAGARA